MSDETRRSLESVRKEAKRWLRALRVNADDARARFQRVISEIPDFPTLRDVQQAWAREKGFTGWSALKDFVLADGKTDPRSLGEYDDMAESLLDAYRTGTTASMERVWEFTWHRRSWSGRCGSCCRRWN